jgi:hypothetical protein
MSSEDFLFLARLRRRSRLIFLRSLAKTQKILAPNGYDIFSNALEQASLADLPAGCRKHVEDTD